MVAQDVKENFGRKLVKLGYNKAKPKEFYDDNVRRDLCYSIRSANYALVASSFPEDSNWMLDSFYCPKTDYFPDPMPVLVKHISGYPYDFSLDSFLKAQVVEVKHLRNTFIPKTKKSLQLPKELSDLLKKEK